MKDLKLNDFNRYMSRIPYNQRPKVRTISHTPYAFSHNLYDGQINGLIDIAIEQRVVCLNDQVFYVHALKDHPTYKSLIFQTNGHIIKSEELTSKIMLRYFRHKNTSYSVNSELGRLLDIHQKCPYLVEGICFAPDGGFSKNNVSWIGLHHIHYIEPNGESTILKIGPYGELVLPIKADRIHKMVHNSSLMALMHQAIANFVAKQYNFLANDRSSENVITQHIQHLSYQVQLPNPAEVYHFMEKQKVVHLLKHAMGIDFPTDHDFQTFFPELKLWKKIDW